MKNGNAMHNGIFGNMQSAAVDGKASIMNGQTNSVRIRAVISNSKTITNGHIQNRPRSRRKVTMTGNNKVVLRFDCVFLRQQLDYLVSSYSIFAVWLQLNTPFGFFRQVQRRILLLPIWEFWKGPRAPGAFKDAPVVCPCHRDHHDHPKFVSINWDLLLILLPFKWRFKQYEVRVS